MDSILAVLDFFLPLAMLEDLEVISLLRPACQDVKRAGTASFSVATPNFCSLGPCLGVPLWASIFLRRSLLWLDGWGG